MQKFILSALLMSAVQCFNATTDLGLVSNYSKCDMRAKNVMQKVSSDFNVRTLNATECFNECETFIKEFIDGTELFDTAEDEPFCCNYAKFANGGYSCDL